jgi:hypothetical protein
MKRNTARVAAWDYSLKRHSPDLASALEFAAGWVAACPVESLSKKTSMRR